VSFSFDVTAFFLKKGANIHLLAAISNPTPT